jgi:hypothetical protein
MRLHTITAVFAGGVVPLVSLVSAAALLHAPRPACIATLAVLPSIVTMWRWSALHIAQPATIDEVLR